MDMQAAFGPEKQEQAKQAYQIGKNIIYNKEPFDALMEEIKQDPANGMARAIVLVLRKIDTDMGRMPYDVALATGLMLLTDIADAVGQINGKPVDDATEEKALQTAVELYLASYGEDNDIAQLQQTAESFGGEQIPQQPQQPPQQPEPGGLLSQVGGV